MKKAKACAVASFCPGLKEKLLGFRGFRGRRRRFGFAGFLALVPVVLLLEFLDAAGRIDVLHLASEERMTRRADFGVDVFLSAARDELVAATAGDGSFFVFGMDVFLHGNTRLTDSCKLTTIITTTRKTSRVAKPFPV